MARKPCKFCGKTNHTSFHCWQRPRSSIKARSRNVYRWKDTVKYWKKKNPPNHQGYWTCYLQTTELCPRFLTEETLTLDHVEPKGSHLDKKFDIRNLKPACSFCNTDKGSQNLELYLQKASRK